MSLIEQPITGQEIIIPPRLPMILKQFCKAAIRTQPYDLLKWSSTYFRALADGEEPPVKLRLEYPPPSTASGLTFGFLRVLLRQFGDYNKMLSLETILHRWDSLCLDRKDLNLIMMIGKFRRKCQVKKFLAIAVGLLGSNLLETMIMICELFTHEPDGGSAMIPVTLFMEIYGYLAGLRCDGSKRVHSDENPMEFVVADESNNSISSKKDESSSDNNTSLNRVYSTASQNTDADINFDLESTSKEIDDSPNLNIMSESNENFPLQNEGVTNTEQKTSNGDNIKEFSSDCTTPKLENSFNILGNDSKISVHSNSNNEDDSCKSENMQGKSEYHDSTPSRGKNTSSIIKRKNIKIEDLRSLNFYPNVPGIGPRLSSEEVASVAIWISECARLQEGMVGPRNLRHVQCPLISR